MSTLKKTPVILLGAGGVGRALIRQIIAGREQLAARSQQQIDVVAVADSQRWVFEPAGLSDTQLNDILAAKRRRTPVGDERPDPVEMLTQVAAAGVEKAVLVDVTAVAGMEPALDKALSLGYGVALANKKALAGPWSSAQHYFNNPYVRHESTVGGGQPVIATMRYLVDTNDPIMRIEGQLSGTLGFICSRMDEGVAFSMALAEARMQGFTEPDPREDLGGEDVMRKALILARMAGWPLEAADIPVESLYPQALAHLSVLEFMQAAVSIDPSMADRVAGAQASGEVLRYMAAIEDGAVTVGLQPVAADSPLANLKYISFKTGRYEDEPLIIAGKGAGVEMTAAGVIGDIITLAREVL